MLSRDSEPSLLRTSTETALTRGRENWINSMNSSTAFAGCVTATWCSHVLTLSMLAAASSAMLWRILARVALLIWLRGSSGTSGGNVPSRDRSMRSSLGMWTTPSVKAFLLFISRLYQMIARVARAVPPDRLSVLTYYIPLASESFTYDIELCRLSYYMPRLPPSCRRGLSYYLL